MDTLEGRFRLALEQLRWDAQVFWQVVQGMLLVHAVYLGLVLDKVLSKDASLLLQVSAPSVGIGLWALFLPAVMRQSEVVRYRILRARDLEARAVANAAGDRLDLLCGQSQAFVEGGQRVTVGVLDIQLSALARMLGTRDSAVLLLGVFPVVYFLALDYAALCGLISAFRWLLG